MALDLRQEETYRKNLKCLLDSIGDTRKELEKKGSLAHIIEVATEEKQNAYTLGYQFYQQQKYDKALIIFNALHLLDPLNKEFAKAQAATMQMQKNFKDAALHFLIAYFFHQEDLELALYAGRCMMEAQEVVQAYFIMKHILQEKRFPDSPENKKFASIIQEFVTLLKKKAEEVPSSGGQGTPSGNREAKTGAPLIRGTVMDSK